MLESLFIFTLPVFRTKQGAWHKRIQLNYKLSPTYSRLVIFSFRELHQTSLSALTAETSLIPQLKTKLVTQTKEVPAWPVINQLWFPEHHFSANCVSLHLGEVQNEILWARSLVFARLVSLAQIGELAFKQPSAFKQLGPGKKRIDMHHFWFMFSLVRLAIASMFQLLSCYFQHLDQLQKRSDWTKIFVAGQNLFWALVLVFNRQGMLISCSCNNITNQLHSF